MNFTENMFIPKLKDYNPDDPGQVRFRKPISELIYNSLPLFYDLFSSDRDRLTDAISEQLGDSHSELSSIRILTSEGEAVGVTCAYESIELEARQSASLKLLIDCLPKNKEIFLYLRKFTMELETLQDEGLYLARIATDKNRQYEGLGSILLEDIVQRARSQQDANIVLHVNKNNYPAIKFYQKHDFKFVENTLYNFRVMKRAIKR